MYNRQLDTFLCVAERGSFSKAAEALYISPSAVTQQMNHLEASLGVELFIRTRHGVTLTEAGRYLKEEGAAIVRHNEELHRNLLILHQKAQKTICVGTGLLQRCRLFYELWPQFDGAKKGYMVQTVDINPSEPDFCGADLIESLSDGAPWQKGLPFIKMLDVPLACAVPRSHPLAQRFLRADTSAGTSGVRPTEDGDRSAVEGQAEHGLTFEGLAKSNLVLEGSAQGGLVFDDSASGGLTFESSKKDSLMFDDLRGNVIVTIHRGMTKVLDDFITDARKQGFKVIEVKRYDHSVFTMCAINQYVLQTPMCWQDLHPDLVTIPCSWEYSLPYGFFVCNSSHTVVREFLAFAREACGDMVGDNTKKSMSF